MEVGKEPKHELSWLIIMHVERLQCVEVRWRMRLNESQDLGRRRLLGAWRLRRTSRLLFQWIWHKIEIY